ncbi:MAG: Do family serine endopeptidase [Bacteroidales bacterium]|nr:Do family serine endopeptidase [Bacteroidales bacterium]
MRKTLFSVLAALGLIAAVPAGAANLSADQQSNYPDFTYAAETAVEAVVYVEVTVTQTYQRPQIDDPFFRFFFGDDYSQPQSRERKGSGSGVIIRQDGYIVTNNHVVSQASKVRVTLNDNRSFDATVIGTDPATDVALIKIEANGLPYLTLADSDKLRLGEWVLAIGSPYDLRSTITAGIVSAKGRSMPNYTGEFKIESFIQTDAAVNPGNSGGALVNKKGELVGVNTAIISQTGSYTGYSFAVPSNIVKKTVADLMDFGAVRRAKLGVSMRPVDEKIAEEMKLSKLEGVYIVEVGKGGAAEKAGIKEGDVIIAVDGKAVTSTSSLQTIVNDYHPGDVANVTYIRDGKKYLVKVTFKSDSEMTGTALDDGTVMFYGAQLKPADSKTLAALHIKAGVEVVSVGNGKLAAAGVQDGLIIRFVNDQPVSKPQDVVDEAGKAGRVVVIEGLTPAGRSVFFALPKEQ